MVEALAVLGMNRSGTSSLTGLVEQAGFHLGDVRTRSRYNAKGNQENPAIWKLHDEVLVANGGSWDSPPPLPLRWTPEQESRLRKIAATYRGREPWAVKDPRLLLTLEAWLECVPGLAFIGTIRNPTAVARSLQKRDSMPIAAGLDLWCVYNSRLVEIWERRPFSIVDFDLEEDVYLEQVAKTLAKLGCRLGKVNLTFFENDLRTRAECDESRLPEKVRLLHEKLQRMAGC